MAKSVKAEELRKLGGLTQNDKLEWVGDWDKLDSAVYERTKAMIEALKPITVPSIEVAPIPMNNGRYGYVGSGKVMVDGKEQNFQVTFTHPSSDGGSTPENIALQRLADERAANKSSVTSVNTVAAAFQRLPDAEKEKFLAGILSAMKGE